MVSDSVLFGLSQLCLTLAECAFLQLLQILEITQFTNVIFETVGRMRLIFYSARLFSLALNVCLSPSVAACRGTILIGETGKNIFGARYSAVNAIKT